MERAIVNGTYHIASGSIAAVLGSTLVGIDMRDYKGRNWVRMCRAYFNTANGRNVFMEHVREFDAAKIGGCYAFDFWGDVLPSLLAMELAACYPQEKSLDEPLRITADRFVEATGILLATPEKFAWSTFDWKSMKPIKNPVPAERDVAGAFGDVLYLAHARFGDPKYLAAAERSLDYLDSLTENPIYACPLPFGAYAMARANAEQGRSYDVANVVNWAFAGGKVCIEGVHAGKYGAYDLSGLVEMQTYQRMYAMETFLWAKSLVPMVRYDARFARAIGKWMTNAASSARYFYPGYLPKEHWMAPEYRDLTRGVIGCECLTAKSHYGDRPIPSAETDKWQNIITPEGKPAVWPRAVNYSLYGSSHVGNLGGIVGRTSDERILELDLLKTDFQHGKAYPTFLYYNPYREARDFEVDVGSQPVDLYDTVTGRYLAKSVSGKTTVNLTPDSAAVLVRVPSGGTESRNRGTLCVNGVVVDRRAARE